MHSKTIISFDFGTKNIGIAIGQCYLGIITTKPITTLKITNGKINWNKINSVINIWKPYHAVVGLPLNMDGSEQHITGRAKKFAYMLYNKFNIKISLHDERLSTIEARSIIFSNLGYKSLTVNNINTKAAEIILTSWFKQF